LKKKKHAKQIEEDLYNKQTFYFFSTGRIDGKTLSKNLEGKCKMIQKLQKTETIHIFEIVRIVEKAL